MANETRNEKHKRLIAEFLAHYDDATVAFVRLQAFEREQLNFTPVAIGGSNTPADLAKFVDTFSASGFAAKSAPCHD
jgi:hypothetical protein